MSGPGAIQAHKRTIAELQDIVVALVEVYGLADDYSGSMASLLIRVANALPPDKIPAWLERLRDAPVSGQSP